ncbi:unnamed protein product [Absidia cylindrospora]
MTTQATRLTPSASIREQYYRKHGIQQQSTASSGHSTSTTTTTTTEPSQHKSNYPLRDEGDDDDLVLDHRPEGAIAFASLKVPDSSNINADDTSLHSRHTDYEDTDNDTATRSIISLQTMDSLRVGNNNNDSGHSTFASSSYGGDANVGHSSLIFNLLGLNRTTLFDDNKVLKHCLLLLQPWSPLSWSAKAQTTTSTPATTARENTVYRNHHQTTKLVYYLDYPKQRHPCELDCQLCLVQAVSG